MTNNIFEKLLLLALNLAGYILCLPFGYLITGYIHGGQILGIPFAILLTIYTCLAAFTKNRKQRAFRILTYGYATTILALGVTLQVITERSEEPWLTLHGENGIGDTLFFSFILVGSIITLVIIKSSLWKTKRSINENLDNIDS